MRFEQPLLEGTLVRRQKRFLADIKLRSGDEVTAHCVNAGSLSGCAVPGSRVLMSVHDDARRRYKYQIEIMYSGRTAVGVHGQRPSAVIAEAIRNDKIATLMGYESIRSGEHAPRDTRIDFILMGRPARECYISVKSATLAYENVAYYPDGIVNRGAQHLQALTDLVRDGRRAAIIFVAQRHDVDTFRPADHIDSEYCTALRDAIARGVEALCFRTRVTRKGIDLDQQIPVELGE